MAVAKNSKAATRLSGNSSAGNKSAGSAGGRHGNPNAGHLSHHKKNLSGSKKAGQLSTLPMGSRAGGMAAAKKVKVRGGKSGKARQSKGPGSRGGKGAGKSKTLAPLARSWTRTSKATGVVSTVNRKTFSR